MTVDDDNSIYVGGIPYDCTESQLRRNFELYGSIVAVKIINDRGVGGRCYGFVTFKNPRSAIEAISEMDGRTIGGRVVRVNEVKTRGAGVRSNHDRESLRHSQREMDWDKGRGRERENDYDKNRQRDHSREYDGERERRRDHSRDRFQGRDRQHSRELGEWERERGQVHSRNGDREWERCGDLNATQDREFDRVYDNDRRVDKIRDHQTKKRNSSCELKSRELSSEASDYQYQVEELLDLLVKRREELQKEKSDVDQRLEEKKQLIADMQKRYLKLEDLLTSAKKLSSVRQLQLTKLYKCFQQVKEYGERLKSSEEELLDLVNSVSMEMDANGDLGAKDAYLTNGKL